MNEEHAVQARWCCALILLFSCDKDQKLSTRMHGGTFGKRPIRMSIHIGIVADSHIAVGTGIEIVER